MHTVRHNAWCRQEPDDWLNALRKLVEGVYSISTGNCDSSGINLGPDVSTAMCVSTTISAVAHTVTSSALQCHPSTYNAPQPPPPSIWEQTTVLLPPTQTLIATLAHVPHLFMDLEECQQQLSAPLLEVSTE